MAVIRGKFLKGTKRKDGSIRYEIEAPVVTKADRMAAIDFEDAAEVEIRLPEAGAQVMPVRDVAISEIRTMLERITDFVEEQNKEVTVTIPECEGCERKGALIEKAEDAITEEAEKE